MLWITDSRHSGFSGCGPRALEHAGLPASWHVESLEHPPSLAWNHDKPSLHIWVCSSYNLCYWPIFQTEKLRFRKGKPWAQGHTYLAGRAQCTQVFRLPCAWPLLFFSIEEGHGFCVATSARGTLESTGARGPGSGPPTRSGRWGNNSCIFLTSTSTPKRVSKGSAYSPPPLSLPCPGDSTHRHLPLPCLQAFAQLQKDSVLQGRGQRVGVGLEGLGERKACPEACWSGGPSPAIMDPEVMRTNGPFHLQ